MSQPDQTPLSSRPEHGDHEHGGAHEPPHGGRWTITVEDEDSGRDLVLRLGRGETVQKAIDELYEMLGRSPDPQDRLTCVKGGVDVLQFATEKLKDYVSRCPKLRWRFVGPTGGAAEGRR